jgi:hypothetical protein
METIISCPICFETYSSSDARRIAMMNTSCGHSCCFECSQKMDVKCALCNQFGRFMKNFALMDQISLVKTVELTLKSNSSSSSCSSSSISKKLKEKEKETKDSFSSCTFEVMIYIPRTKTQMKRGYFYFCKTTQTLPLSSLVGAARNALFSYYQKKIEDFRIYFQMNSSGSDSDSDNDSYGELDLTKENITKRIGVPFPNHTLLVLEKASYRKKRQYVCSFAECLFQENFLV